MFTKCGVLSPCCSTQLHVISPFPTSAFVYLSRCVSLDHNSQPIRRKLNKLFSCEYWRKINSTQYPESSTREFSDWVNWLRGVFARRVTKQFKARKGEEIFSSGIVHAGSWFQHCQSAQEFIFRFCNSLCKRSSLNCVVTQCELHPRSHPSSQSVVLEPTIKQH